ncbi:MAG: 5-oxoprolinase subunit PxpB [Pseudomonadota bacterium]
MMIHVAGENAVICYLGDETSPAVSARVQAAARATELALGNDLVDLVPSYASLLVIYDPMTTDHLSVNQRLHAAMNALDDTTEIMGGDVILPVYYDPEVGEDLAPLAERAGISIGDVIELHSSAEYRVYAIGFAPGFAYLGEVDARIAAPRLSTPRQRVPRGAVAIADRQTAIYPAESPGGWNLIGRCPTPMFDPEARPTMPVQVGDRVRFEPINQTRFIELGGSL